MYASLLTYPETEEQLRDFFFFNAQEHVNILQAIQAQDSINFPRSVLDPVGSSGMPRFLADHQTAHNQFNGLFSLQGNDLESVEWNDPQQRRAWFEIHWLEHVAISQRLRLA